MPTFKEQATFDDVEAIAETPDAVKCKLDDDREVWIPKSQIDDESEVYENGHTGSLVISEWIANEKKLI